MLIFRAACTLEPSDTTGSAPSGIGVGGGIMGGCQILEGPAPGDEVIVIDIGVDSTSVDGPTWRNVTPSERQQDYSISVTRSGAKAGSDSTAGDVQGRVVTATLARGGVVSGGGNQETGNGRCLHREGRRGVLKWRTIRALEGNRREGACEASDARNVVSFRDVLLRVGVRGTRPENEASVRPRGRCASRRVGISERKSRRRQDSKNGGRDWRTCERPGQEL